jgi:hypothetical protein
VSAEPLLVLSSTAPSFSHFRAAQTVLAHLLEELGHAGVAPHFAVAAADPSQDATTLQRLQQVGAHAVAGEQPRLDRVARPAGLGARTTRYVREIVDPRLDADSPAFRAPDLEVKRLKATGAKSAILFWDTWYEHLVPALTAAGMRVYGYLARPPFAAGQSFAQDRLSGPKQAAENLRLKAIARRHFGRLHGLSGARNICALDAAWYTRSGVPSTYLPNTWPDAFGAEWESIRREAESRRDGIHILGNIGGLNATGNRYGMTYLADRVLPLLETRLAGLDWTVNICGRFDLPRELAKLGRMPHVVMRGFVPDIDDEVAGNHIFLLLNNAGPYTGGYTRVIYAMSAGACLIAHRRLAESMPELLDGENCLLGDTPNAIADYAAAAARDADLRARIGRAGRQTYLERYRPEKIVRQLMTMVAGS